MGEVSTIGLDIAKSVFQIHGVDAAGAVVVRKRITRAKLLEFFAALPACLVGIEACPSAHYWSRRLQALGHTVRLMPPSYVKAYVKRSKNDANDAAAISRANCSKSSLTSKMIAFQRRLGSASTSLLANMRLSGQRSWPSRSVSMPGTARVKKVGGWRKSLVLARSSLPRWWPR